MKRLILAVMFAMMLTALVIIPAVAAISTSQQTQHFDTTAVLQSDSTLVVSPAAKTMQILAKHTDSALTIDVMAISPHTPADFGHVVTFTQFDSALKKVQSAHTFMIMDSQVVAVSPPIVQSGSFSSISAVQQKMMRISMVAADVSPIIYRGSVVVIGNYVDAVATSSISESAITPQLTKMHKRISGFALAT